MSTEAPQVWKIRSKADEKKTCVINKSKKTIQNKNKTHRQKAKPKATKKKGKKKGKKNRR